MNALEDALGLLEHVSGPSDTDHGQRWSARCPVHNDNTPSLQVTQSVSGAISVHCFAGCDRSDVRAALGIADVWMPNGIQHEDTYSYTDVDGAPIFEVLRGTKDGAKEIRQRVSDTSRPSGYHWSTRELTDEQRRTLFMARSVADAIESGERIYLVEGEKDVLSAMHAGLTATCNAGGAGKFHPAHADQLKGAVVTIVQDNDAAGRAHGAQALRLLEPIAESVGLADVHPSLPEKADLTDHFQAGFGVLDLVEALPVPAPAVTASNGAGSPPQRDDGTGSYAGGSDSEASERLVKSALEGRFLWTSATDWLKWDGRIWVECSTESVIEVARRWARQEAQATVAAYNADDEKTIAAHKRAVRLLAKQALVNIVSLAKGQLESDYSLFDLDRDIFVAQNGVIDLPTSTLMPHDSSRLVTKSSPVAFRQGATHPDWDAALDAVEDPVRPWLQGRFGQGITGHVPNDDVMGILRGGGDNGKSTLIGAVMTASGTYAGMIPDKVLLADKGNQHPTELMTLKGLRMAVLEETPEERHLDVARMKKVLGTPFVVARLISKDNVMFPATWAIFISTNYELSVAEVDHGTWRRLAKVDFPFRYRDLAAGQALEYPSDRPGDANLRDRLLGGAAQQEAVLAWLIEGARRWYANNRSMPAQPESIRCSTREWRKSADQLMAYAEDHFVADPGAAVWLDDAQRALNSWQQDRGQRPWGMSTFKARLEASPWMHDNKVGFSGQQVRDPATLSRPLTGELRPAPARPRCLLGVRFRTSADDVSLLQMAPSGASNGASRRPMPVIAEIDDDEAA